jgi:DUF1680 family protein
MVTSVRPTRAPVNWATVGIDDAFWGPRLRLLRQRTLPALLRQLRTSGRIDALRLGWQPGMHPVPHPYWDSDVAKWLEASCYSLRRQPDPQLESAVEDVVALLEMAQQPDGYLNSYITSVDPAARWTDLRDGHELYCAGHLIEAGVAHFLATGRRTLIDVMCRYADYIASVFGAADGQKRGYCGHPEIELALVRLYRATGERRYLDLASYFVDERGAEPYYFDVEATRRPRRANDGYYRRHGLRGFELRRYNQSHAPVREQREVVGHAVRAMYLYSAMADLAAEKWDEELFASCEQLWSHLVATRMYITGGIGSSAQNEGFTSDYDLPNAAAYAETCAAIGLVMWAQRMLHLTGDGRYTDVLERALYNGVAAALGADGEHFFYANPLASDGSAHRQPWFQCACCPPNVSRLLESLGQYVYSTSDREVAVHLFVRGATELPLATIQQDHDYPWDGALRFTVQVAQPAEFTLSIRLPGWARGERLHLNGDAIEPASVLEHGYLRIERTWHNNDCVQLYLPMPVERVHAHPAVTANAGKVALQRGPIVYCLEEVDNSAPLHAMLLPRDAALSARFDPDLLGGAVIVQADAVADDGSAWDGQLYRAGQYARLRPQPLVAVPYALWDNRAAGQMQVWIRETSDDEPT